MNFYVVVEGQGEVKVYSRWIPLVNPRLSRVDNLDSIHENNFAIISGGGYPGYFQVIANAIEDVNHYNNVDRLVVVADSHDMSKQEKYQELQEFLSERQCCAELRVVIQHFCLETWALGNRQFPRRNSTNRRLQSYFRFFDVVQLDPELLPGFPPSDLTRAQFAEVYLRLIINDREPRMTYLKSNPIALLEPSYLNQIKSRLRNTSHIASFQGFLDIFRY